MPRALMLLFVTCLTGAMLLAAQADGGKARAPGSLTIQTNPWSHVWVDGRRIGSTPIHRHPLPAGAHRIELHNPVVGQKRNLEVIIQPGKETHLKLDLNR